MVTGCAKAVTFEQALLIELQKLVALIAGEWLAFPAAVIVFWFASATRLWSVFQKRFPQPGRLG